uniref:Amino acid transporter transmembrane domain-containing protein n=1 Tax=Strigamia maritima TaxID=126957 RepID=T1INZ5_STRMM
MSVQFREESIDEDKDVLEPLIQRDRTNPNNNKGTTWYGAIFLVVNAALGAGLLNFPQAYDLAGGLTAALIVQAVLIVFVVAALLIMASCANLNESSSTYQDVVLETCGVKYQTICAVGITLYCYGTCITFLVIIGDQYDRVLASLFGQTFCHYWYMNRHFTISVTSVVFILPICFSRRIDFLKYVSSVGVIAIFYVVFLIIYQYYEQTDHPTDIKTRPAKWMDIFNVVPTICFGYQCHVSAIPIYSCLSKRTVGNFSKTVFAAIIICMLVYSLAGAYGYYTFGSKVPSDVLEDYNAKKPLVLVGILMLTVKTITTYPILLFCGRVAIDGLIASRISHNSAILNEKKRRIIICLVWFATTLIITAFVPNISSVIDILGSLAAIFIFVFPGLCWLMATLTKDETLVLRKDRLIVVLSCIFIAIGMFCSELF